MDTKGSFGSGSKPKHQRLIGGASVANLPTQMKGSRAGKAPYRLLAGNRKSNTINDRGMNAAQTSHNLFAHVQARMNNNATVTKQLDSRANSMAMRKDDRYIINYAPTQSSINQRYAANNSTKHSAVTNQSSTYKQGSYSPLNNHSLASSTRMKAF